MIYLVMNMIVFIQKNDVFTNSKIIAEGTKIGHRHIKTAIKKHIDRFKKFGSINVAYATEIESENKIKKSGRKEEFYFLNEQQSTFLITLLKNTDDVLDFKEELVRQFFAMREELRKRQKSIQIHIETRRTLTDTIKSLPDSEHKNFKYKQYTDMIYKIVLGKNAKQKRIELGLGERQSIVSFLNSQQIEEITELEKQATLLLDMGFDFEQIQSGLTKLYEKTKNFKPEVEQYKLIGI